MEKYILPGQRVDLRAVMRTMVSEETPETKTYTTKVYDIQTEDRMEILMPMEQTKLILLPVDSEFELFFFTENGLYQCIARVIDRYKSNNVYLLLLEMTTNLRKYQRREFYRFSCALEMDTRSLADQEIMAVEKKKTYLVPGLPLKHSIILDISGGGLRFLSNFKYDKDSLVYCKYSLMTHGGLKTYEIVGKILEVAEAENRPGEYKHRVKYQNLDNETREEIIQFIFEEERKNRKREKGF